MKCTVCMGACCEEITVKVDGAVDFPKAAAEWFLARGAVAAGEGTFAVESRCPKLTECGLCSIHDEKPIVCALMPVGGDDCLGAVRRRRTAAQYAEIRDEGDPETIHGL